MAANTKPGDFPDWFFLVLTSFLFAHCFVYLGPQWLSVSERRRAPALKPSQQGLPSAAVSLGKLAGSLSLLLPHSLA